MINSEWSFVKWEKGLFLSVYVDDTKLAGKEQNINPIWKMLVVDVDLGEEENESLGEMSTACSKIVLKFLFWYFVVCEQARACFHKWPNLVTNAWCVWSLTFIIQVSTGNIVLWETQHNNADWDCFKILLLQETLKTQNLHQEELCVFSEVERSCQEVGRARNKPQFHTVLKKLRWVFLGCRFTHGWDSRSRSLGLSDWSMSLLTKPNEQNQRCTRATVKHVGGHWKQIPTTTTNLDLTNLGHVPSSGTHSGSNAMLCVFEDNEAVGKMIIKGRSPTMRHVSRTPRVALEMMFDRFNLDSQIQIRCIDTKHQFADILTKGNFKRDEWNNLRCLFNISYFNSICCS